MSVKDKSLVLLRQFYEVGKEMVKLNGDRRREDELGERTGMERQELLRAKRFFEQYTQSEFDQLLSLRKPNGKPLTTGYLAGCLLQLPWKSDADRQQRSAFQREIAENGWTAPEAAMERGRRFGNEGSTAGEKANCGRKRDLKDPELVRKGLIGSLIDLNAAHEAAVANSPFAADEVAMAIALLNRLRQNPLRAIAA